jgi:hypothetical protein
MEWLEWLFSWEVASVIVAIAIGTALATIAPKACKAAKTCFLLASADAIGGVTMWGAKNPSSTWLSAMLVFVACGIFGLSALFLLEYVGLKEAQERPIEKPRESISFKQLGLSQDGIVSFLVTSPLRERRRVLPSRTWNQKKVLYKV